MRTNTSHIKMEEDAVSANAAPSNSKWLGTFLAIVGILLILGAYIAIWFFRGRLPT